MSALEETPVHQPLSGLIVIDLTTFLSGPFCTQILADLGARVIKLEALEGDSSREIPPHFIGPDSAYYLGNNRNKESISLNLKSEAGQKIARDLISKCDVVVENFRPGVCERLGLDVAALRAENPALIWASITGFGQDGPWRDRVAYDMIVQALSGVMSLTGELDRPSVRLGIPAGDLVAGLFATIGVLSALFQRSVTGEGEHIDVAMLDGQLTMLSYQAVYSMHSGVTPAPQGSGHDSIPTYRTFVGSDDRPLVVTANTERMWRSLCEVLNLSELVDERRFEDANARLENREALWNILEPAFAQQPAHWWVERLNERSVPAAEIKTVPEALADAEESGRGMILDLTHPDGRRIKVVNSPIRFVGKPDRQHQFPPLLGEDAELVLAELLGMSASEVVELRDQGVLSPPPDLLQVAERQ